MTSFLKTSIDQNAFFFESGASYLLLYGKSLASLEGIYGDDIEKRQEKALVRIKEWQQKLLTFFEASNPRASLKKFICKRSSETRSLDLRISGIVSYLLYKAIYDNNDAVNVSWVCTTVAKYDPDQCTPLEIRRLIAGILLSEGLLQSDKSGDKIGLTEEFMIEALRESASLKPEVIAALKAANSEKVERKAEKKTKHEVSSERKASILVIPPQQIYTELMAKIIGQDAACKIVATRGHLHLRRAALMAEGEKCGRNECLLFVGSSSGCGKTMMASEASKIFKQPFTCFDSTLATSSGFVGLDIVQDSLRSLVYSVGDPRKRETFTLIRHATLFYDEFTKKSVKEANNTSGRDISGHQVQVEVLKLMEGCPISLASNRRNELEFAVPEISTDGMFLIFAGLIDNFELALKRLRQRKSALGFGTDSVGKRGSYLYDLLVDYGLIPEFLNRLSAIVPFRQLGLDDFVRIATYPNGAISQFNRMLEPQGLTISFTEGAIKEMAGFCLATSQARALNMLIGGICEEAVFEGKSGAIEYDVDSVRRAEERLEAE